MKRKRAVITVDLVDESVMETDAKIARELLEWLREEAVSVPWVKDVRGVAIRDD